MATANFASVNTSKIFAFGANKYITQEDIDANDWPQEWLGQFDECQTQSDAEWCQESAVSMLKEKGWDDSEGWDGDRNYPGSNIAEKTVCVVVCGLSLDIKVTAKTVSGYYSGATFDWDGNDVTYLFTHVNLESGTLTVNPATLTITTGSGEKLYDGTPLTASEVEMDGLTQADKKEQLPENVFSDS